MRVFVFVSLFFSVIAANASQAFEVEILKPIVVAKVDKATQRMNVMVNGKLVHTWKVSTGLRQYDTPTGSFPRPYRMHTLWHSRKYQNAPMPYAVFYKGGYAVHGTKALWRLGTPASHGCVRLDTKHAKIFFQLVKKYSRRRTEVSISGSYKWKRPARYARRAKPQRRRIVATAYSPRRRTTSYSSRRRITSYSPQRRVRSNADRYYRRHTNSSRFSRRLAKRRLSFRRFPGLFTR